jgi:hypothetical protein
MSSFSSYVIGKQCLPGGNSGWGWCYVYYYSISGSSTVVNVVLVVIVVVVLVIVVRVGALAFDSALPYGNVTKIIFVVVVVWGSN